MRSYLASIRPNKEKLYIFGTGIMYLFLISVIYYNQPLVTLLLLPYLYFWYREQSTKFEKKKKNEMKKEIREFLQSLTNSLTAGYSMERSIPIVLKEHQLLYPKEKSQLMDGIIKMERSISMNQSMEHVFEEFARSTANEDLIAFSYILNTAKRKGGNLIFVLNKTIDSIGRKNQVEEEITTILAGRVFEKNIMKSIPLFLICYMRIFNPEYLTVLYTTLAGRVVMTISFAAMVGAGKLADKLVDIEV